MSNKTEKSYANSSIQVGMRNGQKGGIIDSIDFGTLGPEQTKTLSKSIVFPLSSELNEVYLIGGTPTADFSGCSTSYFIN